MEVSAVAGAAGASTAPAAALTRRDPWRFAAYPGEIITTPNYRIYTTLQYESILERLPGFMEHALLQYRAALSELPAPKRRMEMYLFHNRRQWTAKTRQILPEYCTTFENLGRGGFTTRGTSVLYYIDQGGRSRDTLAIAAHEGWHQYTQSTFKQHLPIWLDEGIATYMEAHRMRSGEVLFDPSRNDERRRTLAGAYRRDRLIPLEDLLSQSPQLFLEDGKGRLLTYYAQVWALVQFLADGANGRYRPYLAQALADAADGRLQAHLKTSEAVAAHGGRGRALTGRHGPWVILAYFNDDLDVFEAEYLAYVKELAGSRTYGRRWHRRSDRD